jgi:ribonuclease D
MKMEKMHTTIPEIISTNDRLQRLVRSFGRESVLAFDLEADSMHHYWEKVCLIQVATASEAVLIDPLVLPDIGSLASILADPAIRKVFHGADYDVRSMRRDFSVQVNNLFDTMIACQFIGEKEVGLAAVLKKRFGAELDKRYQKADWSKRPLEPAMIAYAAADTSLLVALYRQLESELIAKGRLSWVEEESELISHAVAAERDNKPLYYRFKGADKMEPRTLAVLEELLQLRDEKARLSDRPPFKILSHEALCMLAEKKPRKHTDLFGLSGLSAKQIERYGAEILKAVGRGVGLADNSLPSYPRPSRLRRDRHKIERCKKLKLWRESKAAELGLYAGLVANNSLLEALSDAVPRDMAELEKIPALRRWQKQEFGAELLAELNQIS